MSVLIYMAQPDAEAAARAGDWRRQPATLPIIAPHIVSIGMLIRHDAYRYPDDPVYVVETIGM